MATTKETQQERHDREEKERLKAERDRLESLEGASYPAPYQAFEARLVALEHLVAHLDEVLKNTQESPAAHDARLTALEVLVRAQASEIVSRATELAAQMPSAKKAKP